MTGTRTLVAAAASLVTLALVAYAAAQQTSSVASYTGCLKNGKMESVAVGDAPAAPCGTGQTQVRLSGGDITSLHAGAGLTGGAESGDVELGVDPAVVQNRVKDGCFGNPIAPADASISAIHADGTVTCNHDDVGPSTDAYSGFWDGPETMGTTGANDEPPLIAQLVLPAGKYTISATVDVSDLEGPSVVTCKLIAAPDFDRAFVTLQSLESLPDEQRVALSVVHEFTALGAAKVGCGETFGLTDEWNFLKITAIRVANLSNKPLALVP